ncbi:MAG: DUF262 domain-containing protein [Deltaproteobacteria bacterium]|jgi:uncharacterized protein with ParB-like and HNH nuclease domain|nr:DUF262 domain-containing protein [Deltaproteobacteria bacterium]
MNTEDISPNAVDTDTEAGRKRKGDSVSRQITKLRLKTDFDIRNMSIEYLTAGFKEGDFYLNEEYRHNFDWNRSKKSRYIESIFIGYPVPPLFLADNDDGRCDIVDGVQRISAVAGFVLGDLAVSDLTKLTELNGLKFTDLSARLQENFKKTMLRVIVFERKTSLQARKDFFEIMNTHWVQ